MLAQQQMKAVQQYMSVAQGTLLKTDLTKKEVQDMTEDQRVFKSIGRMFILSTKEEVVEGLKVTWD